MAQASTVDQHRAVPLEITPEAREQLTPFRERTFRAMYDAAMADGGADGHRERPGHLRATDMGRA